MWRGNDATSRFFQGSGTSKLSPDSIGILIDGLTHYTGDVDIRHCQFDNHSVAVNLGNGTKGAGITTIRITSCEFVNQGTAGSIGMNSGPSCSGNLIQGCTFEAWGYGIYSSGQFLKQSVNYFEQNTYDWYWTVGAYNTLGGLLYNSSIGDINAGGGGPTWYYPTGGAACVVLGPQYTSGTSG